MKNNSERKTEGERHAEIALWLIRILRWIPKTSAYDRHLTDCAALAALYYPFGDAEENLRVSHVLKWRKLPSFVREPRPTQTLVLLEGGLSGGDESAPTFH